MQTDSETLMEMLDEKELIALTQALITLQSHPGIATHEESTALYLRDFLNAHCIPAQLQEIGWHRYNVLAHVAGKDASKTLMLTGHMDTVGDYGHAGLFEPHIEKDCLYGRGACDMKGPLAAMVEAVLMLRRADLQPACNVLLAFVADEEFQSLGTEALIRAGVHADAAVLGEPTNLHMCLGNRGLEWVNILVHGQGGHGSNAAPGANAAVNAARLICKIEDALKPRYAERVQEVLGHPQLNIGFVQGGNQPSTVPESCLIRLDRRWIEGESVAGVLAELQEMIDTLASEHPGFSAALSRDMTNMATMEHGPVCLPKDAPIVQALTDALRAADMEMPQNGAFPGWTDASLLGNFGKIPTLICGPGDIACAHSAGEHVPLAQLMLAAKTYAQLCLRFS